MENNGRTCEWCGEAFSARSNRGPRPRFCGPSHRQRAYEARRGAKALSDASADDAVAHALERFDADGIDLREALAPINGAMRQALQPLVDQQNAIGKMMGESVMASMPKVDFASALAPLVREQNAIGKMMGESVMASMPKVDFASALAPLVREQNAIGKLMSESVMASMPKVDFASALAPLVREQNAIGKMMGESVMASMPKVDFASVMGPVVAQQAEFSRMMSASVAASLPTLRVDYASIIGPLVEAAQSSIEVASAGALGRGPDIVSLARTWMNGLDPDLRTDAMEAAGDVTTSLDLEVATDARAVQVLIAAALLAIVIAWTIEMGVGATAIAALRSATASGELAVGLAEEASARLPDIQNLQAWVTVVLLGVAPLVQRSRRDRKPE